MFSSFLRHPVIGRASSTFILCGGADVTSQLFLKSPAFIDPDRTIRYSLSGSLSVVPVWFGWNQLLNGPLNSTQGLLKRIFMEAFLLGPLYLSSVIWWNTALRTHNMVDGIRAMKESFLDLYIDALKVVPAYNAFTYFAIAPHMRGYALTGFQFLWNIYVSWFVDAVGASFGPSSSGGVMLEVS
jgi:hypothetical protein